MKLKKEFLALDLNGDGDISVGEMEQMLMSEKIKLRMSIKEIKALSKGELFDGNEHQSISRVYSMQKAKQTEMISGDINQQIFRLVDAMKTEIKVL